MTAADKRKTIAAIRKVARWMSDPRHRVANWNHMYEDARREQRHMPESASRTCLLGAWWKIVGDRMPFELRGIAEELKGENFSYEPWTTAELRKLFRESIKAVEAA